MYQLADLIKRVKRFAAIPADAPANYEDSDIGDFLTEALQEECLRLLISSNAEYLVTTQSFTMPIDQDHYILIPSRAAYGGLREVALIDPNDDKKIPQKIPFLPVDQLGGRGNIGPVYWIKGNKLYVVPSPNNRNENVQISWYVRPSRLVDVADAAQITNINTTTNEVTVLAVPTGMTASSVVDFIQGNPQFELLAYDVKPTGLTSNVFTFSVLPDGLAVGDFLTMAQTSPVPMLPLEMQPILCQFAVVKILEAIGDPEGVGVANAKLETMKADISAMLAPRVQGESIPIPTSYRFM